LNGTDDSARTLRKTLANLGKKYNSNIEQLAVAWIHKLGALPIIGSLNKERIHNAATAENINLSHADWHEIYDLSKQLTK
jgi:predicted oxidoreductase